VDAATDAPTAAAATDTPSPATPLPAEESEDSTQAVVASVGIAVVAASAGKPAVHAGKPVQPDTAADKHDASADGAAETMPAEADATPAADNAADNANANEGGVASASAGFEKTGAGGSAASDNSASVGAGVATALVMVACAIAIVAAVLYQKRKAPPASAEDVAAEDRALDNQVYASITEENKDFDFYTVESSLGSVASQIEKRASQRASGKNKAFVAASLAGFGPTDATVYESTEHLDEPTPAVNAVAIQALATTVHDYAEHAGGVIEPTYAACADADSKRFSVA